MIKHNESNGKVIWIKQWKNCFNDEDIDIFDMFPEEHYLDCNYACFITKTGNKYYAQTRVEMDDFSDSLGDTYLNFDGFSYDGFNHDPSYNPYVILGATLKDASESGNLKEFWIAMIEKPKLI